MDNLIGQSVGRYHITEILGKGGMATVFKAFDTRLDRYVAIKFIRSDAVSKEMFLKRFEREAKALASLSHPNIVKIHDYGTHEGMPYLVMEYIPGGTLKERMGNPMPPQAAARLILPIAQTLDYIHRQNIIHRDVKPANFLMTENGVPMLSDFGIAKMVEQSETSPLTGTGTGIGTPEYMAPEQGMGEKVDQCADIYSLGVVFYELVTGKKPFRADTPMAVLMKHVSEPLPSPRRFVPILSDDVVALLEKALEKKPSHRFQSMAQFAAALERITKADQITPAYQTVKAPPRGQQIVRPQPQQQIPAPQYNYPPRQAPAPTPITQPELQEKKSRKGLWLLAGGFGFIACIVLAIAIYYASTMMGGQQTAAITSTAQSLASTIQANQQLRTHEADLQTQTVEALQAEQTQAALSAEQTAQAEIQTQTAIAEQQMRDQTATAEAEQSEATQTALDEIFANFQAAQQTWRSVQIEEFNAAGDWSTGSYESEWWTGTKTIISGKFRWDMTAQKGFLHYASGIDAVYANMLVRVDCTQSSGSENGENGLVLMLADDNKYYFTINSNTQRYEFNLFYGGEFTLLAADQTQAIRMGQTNIISIKAENGLFTIVINDELVTQVEDNTLREGKIALTAGLSNPEEKAVFEFDNLTIQAP